MDTLQGRVALVTGGSRGIGAAIARRLGRDGATVVLTYARDEAAAAGVADGIRANGGEAFALRSELGHPGDAARLWASFDAAVPDGGVDIIVNNAGVGRSSGLAGVTEEEFDHLFAVNVRAPLFIVQQGLDRLRDGGRIINISTGLTRIAMPDLIAYGPSKAALENITRNLAQALGPRGITANAVSPGFVDTDLNASWLRGNPEAEAYAASVATLGRVGQPDDIADIVAFLASDDARWVTGQTIDATGGSSLGA